MQWELSFAIPCFAELRLELQLGVSLLSGRAIGLIAGSQCNAPSLALLFFCLPDELFEVPIRLLWGASL